MSTLEKFGILVILILVVVIGVVAVWGVGGEESANPFDPAGGGDAVANAPGEAAGPSGELPPWPSNPGPAVVETPPAAVPPPAVDAPVTPPSGGGLAMTPPAPPAPASQPGSTYEVRKGDTLTKIAAATLGDGNKWKVLVDANPGLDPRRLKIGQVIRIPGGVDLAMAPSPAPAPTASRPKVHSLAPVNPDDGPSGPVAVEGGREVEVKKGDSWYSLAVTHLGDGNKWKKLMGANQGIGERDLRPGMKVKLPAGE